MTNWNMVEVQWNQMASQVKARWTKLSVDEIEQIAGKRKRLVAKLQESYGIFQLEAENQVTTWVTKIAKLPTLEGAGTADTATTDTATTPTSTPTPASPADEAAPAAPTPAAEPTTPAEPARADEKAPEPAGN